MADDIERDPQLRDFKAEWGAFVAGLFLWTDRHVDPEVAWSDVWQKLTDLGIDNHPGSRDDLRQWAAAWAVEELAPEILLRRRWW